MDIDSHFIVDKLNQSLPFPRKKTNGGSNIHCPMCVLRGEPRPDTKFRCGIRTFGDGSLHINCFNCGFRTKWSPGDRLSRNLRSFLSVIGVGETEIRKLGFKAWQLHQNVDTGKVFIAPTFIPNFSEVEPPKMAQDIQFWLDNDLDHPDFFDVIAYAASRGEDVLADGKLMWSPESSHRLNRRLIIPFFWENKLVGYTGRAIDDDVLPKYYTVTQPHFIFNSAALAKDRQYAIVTEGQFDALAIDGVSTQGAKISEEQAYWLNQSGKTIIVLPDRDDSGKKMVDLALKHDWMVSFPKWDDDVKDANDAVLRYGRLFTVSSIIDSATKNKLQINMLRNKLNG